MQHEAEWLNCKTPGFMYRWITRCSGFDSPRVNPIDGRRPPSERQLRLFAQACAYRFINHNLEDIAGWLNWADRHSLEGPEIYEFSSETAAAYWCGIKRGQVDGFDTNEQTGMEVCHFMRECFTNPFQPPIIWYYLKENQKTKVHGKSVLIDTSILTPQVLYLAEAAYEKRQRNLLDPMILLAIADELEEAGLPVAATIAGLDNQGRCKTCQGTKLLTRSTKTQQNKWYPCPACSNGVSPGIIEHLRSPNPHPYGCWAMEFLLSGKQVA